MSKNWSDHIPTGEAHRRASGRRAYNAQRQREAWARRVEVAKRLKETGLQRGARAQIARELGVSEATVSRDVAAMLPIAMECPCCGSIVPRKGLPAILAGLLHQGGKTLAGKG